MLLNKARATEYMQQYGVDAVVATSPHNVSYLTDLDCWFYRTYRGYMFCPGASSSLVQSFAVLPQDKDAILILGKGVQMFASRLWVKDVRTYGDSPVDFSPPPIFSTETSKPKRTSRKHSLHSRKEALSPLEVLCSTLKQLDLERSVIGVDCEGLDTPSQTALKSMLPEADIRNCSELLRFVRMVKSEEEIARLRRAAEINEKAAMKSLSNVTPGVSAREISQIYSESIVKEGALPFYAIYSRSGTSVTADPSYRFRLGETVFFDFSCIYEMYYADTGNTVMVGEVSSNSVKVYHWLGDALSLALKEVKPGAKPSVLMEIMRSSLAERGMTQTDVQGHGIGLEARDYPAIGALSGTTLSDGFIEANTDIPFEEGMVINLETPYYPFGKGSFQIERTVVVTKNGFSDMTPQDRESPVLGV